MKSKKMPPHKKSPFSRLKKRAKSRLSLNSYKRSLELATAGMVEILDVERLLRLIVYMIVRKVKVAHAGILLYDDTKKTYVLTSSRGTKGSVIPKEYIRMDMDAPIVRFFTRRKSYLINKSGAVRLIDLTHALAKKKLFAETEDFRDLILGLKEEMLDYDVDTLVPGYFQTDHLTGILFLGKKLSNEEFGQDELNFFMALARTAVMAIRAAQLYKNIQRIFYGVIKAMTLSIEKFDPDFTRPHMDRIFEMGTRILERVEKRGIKLPDIPKELFISAIFLHDIGKQYTPREILHKADKLTEEEWRIMKKHPVDGAEIFEQIEGLEEVASIIRYHQEKYDGTGYPEGLKGDAIPLGARIAAVLDAFDAMTNPRPYRKTALSIKDAAGELIRERGKQFDPELVDIFTDILVEDGLLSPEDFKGLRPGGCVEHLFDKLVCKPRPFFTNP